MSFKANLERIGGLIIMVRVSTTTTSTTVVAMKIQTQKEHGTPTISSIKRKGEKCQITHFIDGLTLTN